MTGNVDADRESAPEDRIAPEGDPEDRTDTVLDGDPDSPEYHAARAALYGLVGGLFVYPEEERLAELTADESVEGVEQAADRLGLAGEVGAVVDELIDADLESLQSAYRGLFDVPEGGEYEVVPYEGHYTTGSEVSEEQRRIATVVGLMEQFNVEPGAAFDERQDHVAAELELMQVVTAQRATALFQGKDEQAATLAKAEATILDEHLVGFVPAFAHELRGSTDEESVYTAAATLAERLVSADHATHDTSQTVHREEPDHV